LGRTSSSCRRRKKRAATLEQRLQFGFLRDKMRCAVDDETGPVAKYKGDGRFWVTVPAHEKGAVTPWIASRSSSNADWVLVLMRFRDSLVRFARFVKERHLKNASCSTQPCRR
jgi:hypothetical protein